MSNKELFGGSDKPHPAFIIGGEVCKSEMLKEYALFAGEEEAYCYIDATEGEYIPIRGGHWNSGGSAGVFNLSLLSPRSSSWAGSGGRSAFFKKKQKAER